MVKPFIMVAPTGARRMRKDHPALPLSMVEIVDTARACQQAGADGLHLHIRDAEGRHTLDPVQYAEVIAEVETGVPGLAVQITTEAAGRYDVATQVACVEALRPAWASVSIREMARDPDRAARLYAVAAEADTRIQHILYDTEDAALLAHWRRTGIIRDGQRDVILVLGRYHNGPPSDPTQIAPFVSTLSPSTNWMVCAFGRTEHSCLLHAAAMGGDIRVGFENSLMASDGTKWRDNAISVSALVRALSVSTRPRTLTES